jgi:hypothetical protein
MNLPPVAATLAFAANACGSWVECANHFGEFSPHRMGRGLVWAAGEDTGNTFRPCLVGTLIRENDYTLRRKPLKAPKGRVCDEVCSRTVAVEPMFEPMGDEKSVTQVCAHFVTHVSAPCREGAVRGLPTL